jgi:hypothetical protein
MGLIFPIHIPGQSVPSATQTTITMPKPESQQPVPAGNGATASPTDTTHRKPQRFEAHASAAGPTSAIRRPAQTTSPPATDAPKKTLVRQGGASEPSAQIVTDMDPAEAARKREDSERLLSAADESLQRMTGRAFTERQQETISQIDRYITVARSALKEGDIVRGHTLALKANLLAQDLEKHQ